MFGHHPAGGILEALESKYHDHAKNWQKTTCVVS